MAEITQSSLTDIYFSGYKNLFECHLALNQTTIIVGSNNSGKSNFLELFKLLSDLHFGGQDARERIQQRIVLDETIDIKVAGTIQNQGGPLYDVAYKLSLKVGRGSEKSRLHIIAESFDYKQKSSPGVAKQVFHRKENILWLRFPSNKFKRYDISAEVPAYAVIRASFEPEKTQAETLQRLALYFDFLEYFKTTVFSAHKINADYDKEIEKALEFIAPLQENKSPDFEKFSRAFTDILGFSRLQIFDVARDVKGLDIKSKIFLCFVFQEPERPMYIGNLSDGSKILFLMLYNIFIKKSPLICVEEPEIGLHPGALNKLLKIFLSGDGASQALITTHSAYLLNLLDPKNVFLMEGTGSGKSTLTPASKIKDLEARLKGKYVNFGDLFADNFKASRNYKLRE